MSPDLRPGEVRFENVVKEYRLGKPRAFFAGAWPFGTGVGRGPTLRALDDVSFTINPGESFALIGSNGAGKSTALKCLAGVTSPTHGRVRHGGRVVALIELGIGFHPDLSGIENARFAATMAGVRGRAARELVDRAVEFSELDKFMSTPVKRYSSGMYARLSFGIAANLPADLLIVDEILAVGDLAFQRKCYAHLASLRRAQGVTLVFVSHNEWVLKETCERGALIAHGHVKAIGPVDDLLVAYHAVADDGEVRDVPTVTSEGQRMRFVDVEFRPRGVREHAVHAPFHVDVTIEVAEGVEKPVVSMTVFNHQSRLVIGMFSDEQGMSIGPGRHDIAITMDDLPLLPGPYRVEVTAFERGSPQGEDVRKFEIDIVGDVPSAYEHGLVHVPSEWRIVASA